jgi:hypothetical protein
VLALEAAARKALAEAETLVTEQLRATRSEGWDRIDPFLEALTGLRKLRGQLISRKEVRFIDVPRLEALEQEVATAFDRAPLTASRCSRRGRFGDPSRVPRGRRGSAIGTAAVEVARDRSIQVAGGLDLRQRIGS